MWLQKKASCAEGVGEREGKRDRRRSTLFIYQITPYLAVKTKDVQSRRAKTSYISEYDSGFRKPYTAVESLKAFADDLNLQGDKENLVTDRESLHVYNNINLLFIQLNTARMGDACLLKFPYERCCCHDMCHVFDYAPERDRWLDIGVSKPFAPRSLCESL